MSNKSFQDDGYEKYSKMLPEKMNLNEVGGALARMTMYREAYERLRTDLAAARKWAKLWKMQATGERIQKEQCIDALADVTHERNKLLDQQVVSRVNINSAHKEIERLNGRRCADCKKSNDYMGGDTVYCNKQYATVIVMGDHYCKSWEKR